MASMKEVDLLMETCLRQGAEPDFLPGLIVEFLPPDRVDAYMAGLSAGCSSHPARRAGRGGRGGVNGMTFAST